VEEHLLPVQRGDPLLGAVVAVVLRRRIEEVQIVASLKSRTASGASVMCSSVISLASRIPVRRAIRPAVHRIA
jgi:hypothetical protein